MNDTANATPDGAPPLVVVGTSAGGNETLGTLLDGLPGELAACILIVRHLPPEGSIGYLIKQLESRTRLACREGKDGDPLVPGTVYFAPPDHHLLVDESKVWVVRGARENRWRPAIDPLFRSAAVSHRERVAGVVLTGHLDDGAAGLSAIKRCGGVCIVQDPDDASFPDMPRNALQRVEVDHCVPAGSIGGVIGGWLENGFGKSAGAVPEDLETEARIARGALADVACVEKTGTSTAMTCPDCGGVLWQNDADGFPRFRCHTGHAFSPSTLLHAQSTKIEETLWVALRMFEERRMLLQNLSNAGGSLVSKSVRERAAEAQMHIERLRSLLP